MVAYLSPKEQIEVQILTGLQSLLPCGVTGSTPLFDRGDSWFKSTRGNNGQVAEWLGSALQKLPQEFETLPVL